MAHVDADHCDPCDFSHGQGHVPGPCPPTKSAVTQPRPQLVLLCVQALGMKPKSSRNPAEAQLDQQELQKLLQRGGGGEERDELGAGGSGLGFGG